MPKHALLTLEEEQALSKRVQDWVLIQSKFKELSKKHSRTPTNIEWASALGMTMDEFTMRWKDSNRVCSSLSPPPYPCLT